MALNINGIELSSLYVDGVEIEDCYINGVRVGFDRYLEYVLLDTKDINSSDREFYLYPNNKNTIVSFGYRENLVSNSSNPITGVLGEVGIGIQRKTDNGLDLNYAIASDDSRSSLAIYCYSSSNSPITLNSFVFKNARLEEHYFDSRSTTPYLEVEEHDSVLICCNHENASNFLSHVNGSLGGKIAGIAPIVFHKMYSQNEAITIGLLNAEEYAQFSATSVPYSIRLAVVHLKTAS